MDKVDDEEWPPKSWITVHNPNKRFPIKPPLNRLMGLDAILIPGGGLQNDGKVTPWVKARLDAALRFKDRTRFFITLSRGTVYKQNVIVNGNPVYEAEAGKRYLLANGIPPNKVITETESLDTLGNAYFARLLTDSSNLRTLLIITSAFHMIRAGPVFDIVYDLPPDNGYSLHFLKTPNVGFKQKDLDARIKKEDESLRRFGDLIGGVISTFADLSRYMRDGHEAYKVGGKPEALPKKTLRIY